MKPLTRVEEILLITILRLEENAYGVSIRDRIRLDLEEKWSFGSIYPALDKLVRLGLLRRIKGEPLSERGGKSRFLYRVTPGGLEALMKLREVQDKLWADLPAGLTGKKTHP